MSVSVPPDRSVHSLKSKLPKDCLFTIGPFLPLQGLHATRFLSSEVSGEAGFRTRGVIQGGLHVENELLSPRVALSDEKETPNSLLLEIDLVMRREREQTEWLS